MNVDMGVSLIGMSSQKRNLFLFSFIFLGFDSGKDKMSLYFDTHCKLRLLLQFINTNALSLYLFFFMMLFFMCGLI